MILRIKTVSCRLSIFYTRTVQNLLKYKSLDIGQLSFESQIDNDSH